MTNPCFTRNVWGHRDLHHLYIDCWLPLCGNSFKTNMQENKLNLLNFPCESWLLILSMTIVDLPPRINGVNCLCINHLYIDCQSPLWWLSIGPPGSTVLITSASIASTLIVNHLYDDCWPPRINIVDHLCVDRRSPLHWLSIDPPTDFPFLSFNIRMMSPFGNEPFHKESYTDFIQLPWIQLHRNYTKIISVSGQLKR